MKSIGRITRDLFPDGHGGDIEICSCGWLGHFSDQSSLQVKSSLQAIAPLSSLVFYDFVAGYHFP